MTAPRISVVMAFRNGRETMPAAVDSVLAQDVPLEIILVDDGSTDDTPALAQGLLEAIPEVAALVRQRNRGAAAARNVGLQLARAPYVCFFDVDDTFTPGYFQEAIATLDARPEAVAVYPDVELVGMHRPVHPLQHRMIASSISASLVMRTDAVRALGGYPVNPALRGRAGGEDVMLRQALAQLGQQVFLDHPYYRYLTQPGGHLDFFLDRTEVRDGQVVFNHFTDEERSGEMSAALHQYLREVRGRQLDELRPALHRQVTALSHLPGLESVGPHVAWLYRHWPGQGATVALEAEGGPAEAWLSDLPREVQRGSVVLTDGPASEGEPVRLLLVDAGESPEKVRDWLDSWLPRVAQAGVVMFYNLDGEAGNQRYTAPLLRHGFQGAGETGDVAVMVRDV